MSGALRKQAAVYPVRPSESRRPRLHVLARALYDARRRRDRFMDPAFLGEPSWDILLDLYASKGEGRLVSVGSACIAADAASTTALRHLHLLCDRGAVTRRPSPSDSRRVYVALSADMEARMTRYLQDYSRRFD